MGQVSFTQTRRIAENTESDVDAVLQVPGKTRILIICENEFDTERLKTIFQIAGLTSESADNMTAGCELVKSGRFRLVFCTPLLGDGSWLSLIEVACRNTLDFEVILLARTFDLYEWAEALQVGAFDVLDVLCDLPKAAETARRALGTGYLKRFRRGAGRG